MIIEKRKSDCLVNLSDIKMGECFKYGDKYYIRSNENFKTAFASCCENYSDVKVLDIKDGGTYVFEGNRLVRPVKAKLVIISEE